MLDYDKIPVDYMTNGMKNYIEHGIEPGGFMYSLITNDLKGTFTHADETNGLFIKEWVEWVLWEMPHNAQGSVANVNQYIESVRAVKQEGK